jgi:TRAP-type uncharacterized transport system substrate-binding protein
MTVARRDDNQLRGAGITIEYKHRPGPWNKNMNKLTLNKTLQYLLCSWLLLGPFSAAAEAPAPLVVSSGIHGGGYWSAATRLQAVAEQQGLEVRVLESRGSLHNLQRLNDPASDVSVAFTQADALQYFLDKNPGLAEQGEILEDIGQECVYLITGKESGLSSLGDLRGRHKVAIGSARSGVAVTFDYMKSLLPELTGTEAVYSDTRVAQEQLGSGAAEADAVMVVHRPKEHSPELDRALAEPGNYNLVEIQGERLNGKLPNGDAVYNALNLALPGSGSAPATSVKTICVKGLLVFNKHKLSREQRYKLGDLVSFHWMKVYLPGS